MVIQESTFGAMQAICVNNAACAPVLRLAIIYSLPGLAVTMFVRVALPLLCDHHGQMYSCLPMIHYGMEKGVARMN